jgi:hypothetical protein
VTDRQNVWRLERRRRGATTPRIEGHWGRRRTSTTSFGCRTAKCSMTTSGLTAFMLPRPARSLPDDARANSGAVRAKSTMASATADGARLRPARAAEAARGSCAEARDGAQAGVAPAARPSASVRTRALPPFVMKVRAKASYPGPRRLHRGSRDCSKRGRPASPRLFVATHSGFRSDFGEGRERHRASDDRQT